MDDLCPFCGRDPYHYVDIGVGMEAVAIDCCDEMIDAHYGNKRLRRLASLLDSRDHRQAKRGRRLLAKHRAAQEA